jgi:hypothetical protein
LVNVNVKQAREAEPYLARFEDDWATGQILRQYLNGKHKYEATKASGKVKMGGKQKQTTPGSPLQVSTGDSDNEINQANYGGRNGGCDDDRMSDDDEEYNDEWVGFTDDYDMGGTSEGSYDGSQ